MNLTTGKFYPSRKPDNIPLYINAKSNHPLSMIKYLLTALSTRISTLSCDNEEFDKASSIYSDAFKSCGYKQQPPLHTKRDPAKRKSLKKHPAYSENLQTDVARTFLRLIDKHFPRTHILHTVINRNDTKVVGLKRLSY